MTFPNVSAAFWGWTNGIKLRVVSTAAVDFEAQQVEATPLEFDGVIEPLPERKLMVKPEGQRSWQWWTLWTQKVLKVGDIILDPEGRRMRVMSESAWNVGSDYREYQLTEGFNAAS